MKAEMALSLRRRRQEEEFKATWMPSDKQDMVIKLKGEIRLHRVKYMSLKSMA